MVVQNFEGNITVSAEEFLPNNELATYIQENVISRIVKEKQENEREEIRLWVAGCSTGQEVYSLAILLNEYLEAHPELEFKIYATDLDKDSIRIASAGIYPKHAFENVLPDIQNKYFDKKDDFYVVNKEIRKRIIFAPHNIAKDPMFQNLDFISCRNVINYFMPLQQQKIISMFHGALNHNGYLFLGKSETVGESKKYFSVVSNKWKFYRKLKVDLHQASAHEAALHTSRDELQQVNMDQLKLKPLQLQLSAAESELRKANAELDDLKRTHHKKMEKLRGEMAEPTLFITGLLDLLEKEDVPFKSEYAKALQSEMGKLGNALQEFYLKQ
ncbi:protein-glutamate O-methyltransferase CheR [Bacillus tianshenii]|uniref:CheR family methyltransferase n=1 Tax=Sutcliffiella tianshenii TaxID=1463404 RepID=UPI001CD48DA1|nr:protein-glutamate O-methyltransferase CheR [Bacillus tianshenii]MCA1319311.1 protein-glutamate O-methyltransferase CheR [Bacillus tianshenii]